MGRRSEGISKDARDHLHGKLDRMKGIEKKKTIKRLEKYDRGQRARPDSDSDWERG